MQFDYLWDKSESVLLIHLSPTDRRLSMVGVLVSADLEGKTWPLLDVACSDFDDADHTLHTLLVPLPPDLFKSGDPVSVTVEPVAAFGAEPLPADRIALTDGAAVAGARPVWWEMRDEGGWTSIRVLESRPVAAPNIVVVQSNRRADSIFPAVQSEAEEQGAALVLEVETLQTPDGLEHEVVLRPDPAGGSTTVHLRLLAADPTVCDILSAEHPDIALPSPRFSATLPRGTREPVSFHVHSGGRTNPTAGTEAIVQFLDRLVVSTVPPQPIRVILAGRPRGQIDSPVVLVDLGDGAVELDGGALRSRLDGNLDGTAQSPSSDRPSGSVLHAPGPSEAFVEALRCQIVARISRAFPTLPRLRPVNAASLLQSPSLFQTLAALGSGWLPPGQEGALRRALQIGQDEGAELRHLCAFVMRSQLAQLRQGGWRTDSADMDDARIDIWLHSPLGNSFGCVAVLGWDRSCQLLAEGLRPDAMNLSEPSETEMDRWAAATSRLEMLVRLDLAKASRADLLADIHDMRHSMARIEADWEDALDLIETAQSEIGYYPALPLEAFLSPDPGSRPDMRLVQTLRAALIRRLSDTLSPAPAVELAGRMARRLAQGLHEDFRKLLALVQREGLILPKMFAQPGGLMDAAGPVIFVGDAESLSDWLTVRSDDNSLVRSWKDEIQAQRGRGREEMRRQL